MGFFSLINIVKLYFLLRLTLLVVVWVLLPTDRRTTNNSATTLHNLIQLEFFHKIAFVIDLAFLIILIIVT